MSPADIIVIVALLIVGFFAVRSIYKKFKSGGCCGDCSGCGCGCSSGKDASSNSK